MLKSAVYVVSFFSTVASLDINPLRHDVVLITKSNFDGVISKFRDWQIASVMFFRSGEEESKTAFEEYENLAKDMKGMAKIAAFDCSKDEAYCKNINISKTPSVMIYPRLPFASYMFTGEINKVDIQKELVRLLPSEHVKVLNHTSIDNFQTTEMNLPKVLLISDKKNPPAIFKGLSNEFRKEMHFGFVSSHGDGEAHAKKLIKKFNAKKYPALVIIEQGGKKVQLYEGDMNYMDIATWINLRRETFAKGGGFDHDVRHDTGAGKGTGTGKPWLVQDLPQVNKASHMDVCFDSKAEKGLCVIYLKAGNELDQKETDLLLGLKEKFRSHLSDRGTTFRWMWMDLSTETEYKKLFAPEKLPSVVVFNPHKRLRFTKNDQAGAKEGDFVKLLDKILGGDARFTNVKGQKLPPFAEAEAKKEEL